MKKCISCNEKWDIGYNFCRYCGYSPPHPSISILKEKLANVGITHPSQIRKIYLTKEENEIQLSYFELKHSGDSFFDDTGPETDISEDEIFNFITHRISEGHSLIVWPENAAFDDFYEFDPFLPNTQTINKNKDPDDIINFEEKFNQRIQNHATEYEFFKILNKVSITLKISKNIRDKAVDFYKQIIRREEKDLNNISLIAFCLFYSASKESHYPPPTIAEIFDAFQKVGYNVEPGLILSDERKYKIILNSDEKEEKIEFYLDKIKQLNGVEDVLLIQIDGNPTLYNGLRFSKDEIIKVNMAISSIFKIGIIFHPNDLKYILIEGIKEKILIAPLSSPIEDYQFCIAITLQALTKSKLIYQQTVEWLKKIKTILITSDQSPPLAQFNGNEKKDVDLDVSPFSPNLSENISIELRKVMDKFSIAIPDLKYVCITIEKGILASKIVKLTNITEEELNHNFTMSHSLFLTAIRCWEESCWGGLKNMDVDSILLDSENSFHLISSLGEATFITEIGKSRQKLGLIRLIIPQFKSAIRSILEKGFT